MLNYAKMGSITWGAVREIIKRKNEMKKQVQHLENSVYELQETLQEELNQNLRQKQNLKFKNIL